MPTIFAPHSQAILIVGVHPVPPTPTQNNIPFIGGDSVLIGSIIDVCVANLLVIQVEL